MVHRFGCCPLQKTMRALPTPPEFVAPGCRVTAVACNDERCAAAFSLPRSRPEVVVWTDDDETTSYVAPESRTVTALALPWLWPLISPWLFPG